MVVVLRSSSSSSNARYLCAVDVIALAKLFDVPTAARVPGLGGSHHWHVETFGDKSWWWDPVSRSVIRPSEGQRKLLMQALLFLLEVLLFLPAPCVRVCLLRPWLPSARNGLHNEKDG